MSVHPEPSRQQALESIREEYARRTERWDHRDASRRAADERLLARTLRSYGALLERNGLLPLGDRKVLDVGSGRNEFLVACHEQWGHTGDDLCGIELMPDRVERGLADYPYLTLRCGSADQLEWADGTFDLVHQGMLLTSILEPALAEAIVAQMIRVTRPGGYVLWYDFVWNPVNRKTRGIPLGDLRRSFPGWQLVDHRRITVAPPIARRLSRLWDPLVGGLERLRVLNLWELALLRKPASP